MRLLKIKDGYSFLFIAIALVSLLNFRGCRDLQDCRSIYTSVFQVDFKGGVTLALDSIIEVFGTSKELMYDQDFEYKDQKGVKVLKNLQEKFLRFPLHPEHNMVSLLFYRTPPDSTAPMIEPDTLAIFYKRIPSLLSPHCGLQEEYIIDSVATTFAGIKIINSILRNKEYEANPEEYKKPNIEIYY